MVMVDFPVCSPPISGGMCILLVHFQLPAMLLSFANSGAGLRAGMDDPAVDFLASDFSCARAEVVPMANASTASEAMSVIRSCLRQSIAMVLPVRKMM